MSTRKGRTEIKKTTTQSSSELRRAMTEKRYEMSVKLRKTKRSHLVFLKRRLTSGTSPAVGKAIGDAFRDDMKRKLHDLALGYIQKKDKSSLSDFQRAIAGSEVDGNAIDSLLKVPDGENEWKNSLAVALAESLSMSLASEHSTEEETLDASRVLTNLAATEISSTGDDYYGDHWLPEDVGWCGVIIRTSALTALIHRLFSCCSKFEESQYVPSVCGITIAEQCCWALGNIAGDSQGSRDAARRQGAIVPLVSSLRISSKLAQPNNPNQQHFIALCRNAVWALSNLARGAYTSAIPFLAISQPNPQSLLTPHDLTALLFTNEDALSTSTSIQTHVASTPLSTHQPSAIIPSTHDGIASIPVTWLEVSLDTSWLLAFLTAKEEQAVHFLCTPTTTTSLPAALSYRLHHSVNHILHRNAAPASLPTRIAIPVIRSIGNIATACDGQYVAHLITSTAPSCPTIPITLAALILYASTPQGLSVSALALEAAWAASTLLCDAGLPPPHPSTAACETLLPALCTALVSSFSKLEFKREILSAMVNAVSPPPILPAVSTSQIIEDTLPVRNQILSSIADTEDIIPTLIRILSQSDNDAVYLSLSLLDAIFRRLEEHRYCKIVQQCEGVDALESICDKASMTLCHGQSSKWNNGKDLYHRCADMAADLIDDFFSDEFMQD